MASFFFIGLIVFVFSKRFILYCFKQVSPIEYGHVLLIPRVLDCLPQRIDHKSLLLALHMAAEAANPYFRLGYNSLGAFATINHLHFQVYWILTRAKLFFAGLLSKYDLF